VCDLIREAPPPETGALFPDSSSVFSFTADISFSFSVIRRASVRRKQCPQTRVLSSENPVKEGSVRTAVRFHLNLPQGGFWGRCHWALLSAHRKPLRGAKTQRVFILLRILFGSCRKSAADGQNTVMRRLCFPFGHATPPHDGILPATDDAGLGRR
jgi:hypothetical protein